MFSFSSSALVDRPFDWAYKLEDLGYTGWEIVNEGKQRLTKENVLEAKKIAATTKLVITIHLPYSDLNLASMNQPIWEETVRQMKKCLSLSCDFSRLAIVHPGHLSPLGMQMPDRAWSQNILGIQEICDHASELDMKIAVENMVNMPALLGRRPEEIVGILETVNRDNVGFILDVGHANTNGNVNQFLELKDLIIHAHVHDGHPPAVVRRRHCRRRRAPRPGEARTTEDDSGGSLTEAQGNARRLRRAAPGPGSRV
jgi:sugar phosphate isomerase/epimerase